MKTLAFQPMNESLAVQTGSRLLDALLAKRLNVLMSCGGHGLCATCHVHVQDGMEQLTPRTERERRTLSFISGTDATSRLACQCRVKGEGVVVAVPKGMYIEQAEDLLSLLGTRAPDNILHPVKGIVLIAKGKIITRTQIEALKNLKAEVSLARAAKPETLPNLELTPPPVRVPLPRVEPTPPLLNVTLVGRHAPPPAPKRGLAVGELIGKCLIVEKLGQGAMGTVYRALHQKLNVAVAVKVLNRVEEQSDLLDDDRNHQRRVERFFREARLLAQLNHPSIIRVWDFDEENGTPYLVMELVEGLSLDELIRQSGRLTLERATGLIAQVAGALQAAWQVGVIHRDVKPANILLARDGSAKLADLGLARAVGPESGGQLPAVTEGTVAYMSPEQADGRSTDHRGDIYSLGITYYQALTGRLPYTGASWTEVMLAHARGQYTPPHELIGDLPPAVSNVIATMLATKPDDRYLDYGELLHDLNRLLTPAKPTAPAETMMPHGNSTFTGRDKPRADRPAERSSGWRGWFAGKANG